VEAPESRTVLALRHPQESSTMTTASKGTNDPRTELGTGELLRFYLPLVLTSQMMTLGVPLINLALTRAADPQLHLAAYGVCFGLLVFLNAPMLVSRDAGAGLATDRRSWRRLVRVVMIGGALVAGIDLLLAFTALGDWAFGRLMEATPRVVAEARATAVSLAPIPLLVGMRGLYSALALRAHRTRLLTEATFLRMIVLVVFVFLVLRLTEPTAHRVGWALTAGIALETLWIGWVTRPLLRDLPVRTTAGGAHTYWRILTYTFPLVLSAFAWTALRPIVNGILGRTGDSEAAQASFGVLHPLVLLTGSALWALQATHQILATSPERARRALRFGLITTVICSGIVAALGWIPPVRTFLLTEIFTLPPRLLDYVTPAMLMLFVAPFMLGLRACTKGLILASGRTGIISASAVADLTVVLTLGGLSLAWFPNVNGAVLGIVLVTAAEITETLLLGGAALRRFGIGPRSR